MIRKYDVMFPFKIRIPQEFAGDSQTPLNFS